MYDIETENKFWSKILTGEIDECWECVAICLDKDGYGRFWINCKKISAHRFSFQLFHNRLIKDKMFICHKCDNPSCVNPHHLFEGTHQDNMTDQKNKGRHVCNPNKGEKNHKSKLTEKQVLEIRAKYAKGGITHKVLAKEYGVHLSTIGFIINRKYWTHI